MIETLTKTEAASLAGCAPATLQRAVQADELRAAFGPHGALLFDRAEIIGWVGRAKAGTLGRRWVGWGRKSPRAPTVAAPAAAQARPGPEPEAGPVLFESVAQRAGVADRDVKLPSGEVIRLAPLTDPGLVRLTARSIMRRLDCGPDYLAHAVQRRELAAPERIAGRRLWPLTAVLAFEKSQAGKPDKAAAARAAKALRRSHVAPGATSAINRDAEAPHKE